MDHSMQAYLKQLPTNKLEEFLRDYIDGKQKEDYSKVIAEVMNELAHRKLIEKLP